MNTFTLQIDGGRAHPVLLLSPIGVGVPLDFVATTGGSGGQEALPGPARAFGFEVRLGASALDEMWAWWIEVRDNGERDLRPVQLRAQVAELSSTVLVGLEDVVLSELRLDFCPPVQPHMPNGPRALGQLNLVACLQPSRVDLSRGD
jgi:hypothetical protein